MAKNKSIKMVADVSKTSKPIEKVEATGKKSKPVKKVKDPGIKLKKVKKSKDFDFDLFNEYTGIDKDEEVTMEDSLNAFNDLRKDYNEALKERDDCSRSCSEDEDEDEGSLSTMGKVGIGLALLFLFGKFKK